MFAAVALASCSSNDAIEEIVEDEVAIDFEGLTNKSTRAEIADEAALATAGGFAVFGEKHKTDLEFTAWNNTNGTVIFNNVNVTGSKSGSATDYTWTYSGTKYWDKTATYNFYAIAPYEASPKYTPDANGKFTITDVASNLAADSKDYVIDRDGVTNVSGATYAAGKTPVAFDFHHIMAKVDFKANATVDNVVIKKITMSGWDKNTGTFVQTTIADDKKADSGTWNELNCSEWTLATTETTKGSYDVYENSTGTSLTKNTAVAIGNTYIMVPQVITANTLKFTIDYTVGGEPFTAQEGLVTTAQTWGTDSHTTYTINVGPEAITFDVTSVCDFCVPGTANDPNATVN